ncbi:MAG TPA: 50S ribosomal protein L19 [candidate division WOR-3 bacterium]|uniref:Large ribosomal subunit protein bL19 n=1 Tax=candidate division WOR-3 bacterium TaxID=2052148 RepID=A0A7V0T6U1_UNCW3|nr:50S ribosomal protein L19 [candidate division WOR-3 bacterium]
MAKVAKKKEARQEAPPIRAAEIPPLEPGDLVAVTLRIVEGDKTRSQVFEGTVIALRGAGANRSFTVRKVSRGIGIERIFPFRSPVILKVEVKRHSKVRRAKLYYLRERRGRAAQLKERKVDQQPRSKPVES